MSEIYRMERAGDIPPLPEGEQCDLKTTPLVDDCRGVMCDDCVKACQEHEAAS